MKIMLCLLIISAAVSIVIFFSSCSLFSVNDYDVGFRNLSGHKIDVFYTSKMGNYAPPTGILLPSKNGLKGSGSHYGGIPDSIEIKWKKDNGEIIEREVQLKGNMPKGFGNGSMIIFNISDRDEVLTSFVVAKINKRSEIDSKGNAVDYVTRSMQK